MCLGISIQCYQEFVNKKMEIKDADAENLQINKLFRIINITHVFGQLYGKIHKDLLTSRVKLLKN